jgi:predicted Fe-Mo cluster-binding NifX family protein
MKVAVASDDGKTIAAHTGRCRYFVIYVVTEGKSVRLETIDNRFTPHMRGEHGPGRGERRLLHDSDGPHGTGRGGGGHGYLLDALEGVEVLIARGMGPRLVNELNAHGIRSVFSSTEDADEAVRQLAEGELEELGPGGLCDH